MRQSLVFCFFFAVAAAQATCCLEVCGEIQSPHVRLFGFYMVKTRVSSPGFLIPVDACQSELSLPHSSP